MDIILRNIPPNQHDRAITCVEMFIRHHIDDIGRQCGILGSVVYSGAPTLLVYKVKSGNLIVTAVPRSGDQP